ncbi:uncharacterized protein LOC125043073 [Penaeus chinensis]|uniref:uncharacterized protein LOC125043073 n=1 Tax=Penaeus chinensis TaxID=139456 RepID=UPI001FB69805|nr:uncharacterized protein LOC125043073 [Penaeus chinensis]
MDRLTEGIRTSAPEMMMFADDIVLCCEGTQELEDILEVWSFALERRGMKVSRRLTRKNRIRNEKEREVLSVERFGGKTRKWRLRWFGHVRRRDEEYVGNRMLGMKPPGKRKRGRPKRWYMDTINEDMVQVGVTEMDVQDRLRWRRKIHCGNT